MACPSRAPIDTLRSPFSTIANFRDVAISINQAAGRKLLETGKLFRSGNFDEASKDDGDRLRQDTGVKTVIDLQTRSPLRYVPSEEDASGYTPEKVSRQSFLGISYVHVTFESPELVKMMIDRFSFWETMQFYHHAYNGNRDKIRILFRNHAGNTLAEYAKTILECAKPCVQAVLSILADPEAYPVLIQSKFGKEKTGLMVLLVLLLLDAPIQAIQEDYSRSDLELIYLKKERLEESRQDGYTPAILECPHSWVRDISAYITKNYGSIEEYLDQVGINRDMQKTIIFTLGANSSEKLLDI